MTNDTDDLDFAMLTPPTRPGPCKAAGAPEVDPVEERLNRERESAPFITPRTSADKIGAFMCMLAIAVRHGSGKVKV